MHGAQRPTRRLVLFLLLVAIAASAAAQTQAKPDVQKPDTQATTGDLTKAVQNPVASLISVPVQNITDFNIGPFARDRNTVLQFQPVIPVQLGENWNLITRTIGAVTSQPDITQPQQGTFWSG